MTTPMTTVHMSQQGRVVIPAAYRNRLGITPDTDLVCYVEYGRVVYEERDHMKRRLQREALAAFQGARASPVDEFVAERRDHAQQEQEGER
ncbi:AbrB/MazE/SpoVT family DNA-binding domain-containing protein [Haloactinomyces albus]|uniref:Bifunctional DNA-binding transcriptional regulator/antitoxin component of YhaV-PrlF toxin-antitoxin module n=1 Tax=Haloactinomyces albus TaxID=1352928 RepID=A0AAE3ZEL4_9ACTN|nr:AbrB/MazE/SpoVT family DNA-binding domain-containing protein [Haloactinomyces albus]MDR7301589.1 bifunctional DNA-binding transcriptional regulator/antitoxin component of YhaV-PrlF toxin-antitoxin module [Haloactinomyces albus]